MTASDYDLTYLSLGAGVQSTAMLALSCEGERVPRADVAVFADTGAEAEYTMSHLAKLKELSDIPIQVVTAGDLIDQVIERNTGQRTRSTTVPLWTRGDDGRPAPLRRGCTRDFKVTPIEQFIRIAMGYRPRQRVKKKVRCMIGISREEYQRAKPSRTPWIESTFPLVDIGMTRGDCLREIERRGWPTPNQSACVMCPYHSDDYWMRLKETHPDEFARAVDFDRAIRDLTPSGVKNPAYVHRSLKPLDEIDFTHGGQMDFFAEECEGMCGQ